MNGIETFADGIRPAGAGQRASHTERVKFARRINSAGKFAAEGVEGYGMSGDIRPARAGQRVTGAGRGRARVRNFAAERVKGYGMSGVKG